MTPTLFKTALLGIVLASSLIPDNRAEAAAEASAYRPLPAYNRCLSKPMVQLKGDLRKLWTDHTIWARAYIVSALAGIEDQPDLLARLLQNQQDIGNAIKPYYGEEAGAKLTELLREHILIASKIVDEAKKGNQAAIALLNKEWYRNADDLAQLLSSANPNWSKQELKKILEEHLQFITEILGARLKKDWKTDIAATDKNETHMLMFADLLTEGIVKQFPKQFK